MTMRRVICLIVFVILFYDKCNGSENTKQQGGKVMYWNPKYVKDINLFTFRRNRHTPYLTSANLTTLHVWENNITLLTDCYSSRTKQDMFTLEFKICDIIKASWAKDWVKQFSNVLPLCPFSPGTYIFNEIELPPKNFPIPIPPGDYTAELMFVTTKAKEKIVAFKLNLNFR